LLVASFARPGKLFTAHVGLMTRAVGILHHKSFERVLNAVIDLLDQYRSP
jgi:hypothetical protein